MAMDVASDDQRVAVLSSFLMQTLERMAKRLEIFYAKLAQYKVYQPDIERNPARARWNLVRRKIQDGSFFILTQEAVLGAAPAFIPAQRQNAGVDFDAVMSRVQASVRNASHTKPHPQSLNAMHMARASAPPMETSAMAAYDNTMAVRAMSTFIDKNMRAIRRMSKMPSMPMTFEQLQATVEQQEQQQQQQAAMMPAGVRPPTPPSSGGSTRSPSVKAGMRTPMTAAQNLYAYNNRSRASSLERLISGRGLNRRSSVASVTSSSPFPVLPSGASGADGHGVHSHDTRYPSLGLRAPPTPPPLPAAQVDAATAMNVMTGKMNVRSRGTSMPPAPLLMSAQNSNGGMLPQRTLSRTMSMRSVPGQLGQGKAQGQVQGQVQRLSRSDTHSSKLSTNSLRAFRLGTGVGAGAGANGVVGERGRMSTRVAPTF